MTIEKFDASTCLGDSISVLKDGFEIIIRVEHDIDYDIGDNDMLNIDRSVTGCSEEQQATLLNARQAWERGEWFCCGLIASVIKNGIVLSNDAASAWGLTIDHPGDDNVYLNEVAEELIAEAIHEGKTILGTLLEQD